MISQEEWGSSQTHCYPHHAKSWPICSKEVACCKWRKETSMPLVQKLFAWNFKFCCYWDWGFNFYNFEKICMDTKKEMPVSEILFLLIKSKPEIEGIKVFDYNYLYSAYCWWYNLFLRGYYFYKAYVWRFLFFSLFSGLNSI